MSVSLTIAVIAPSILNTNGDAENAQVLARRAEWAGASVRIVPVETPAELPSVVDAVVVGSGSDSALAPAQQLLLGIHNELRTWATEGVPILAVGIGWELLSWGVEFADGSVIEGLGLLPGRAVPAPTRSSGDLVVATRYGRLVGFENHARAYVHAEGSPLGRTAYGIGNGRDSGQEGVVMGDVIGTHLHGPVLAKNPGLADAILGTMFTRAGTVYVPGEGAVAPDDYAHAARAQILAKLGLPAD